MIISFCATGFVDVPVHLERKLADRPPRKWAKTIVAVVITAKGLIINPSAF